MTPRRLVAPLAAAALAAGCGQGPDPGLAETRAGLEQPAPDLSGTWSFRASLDAPPRVESCTEGLDLAPACGFFIVPLRQKSDRFSGAGLHSYCAAYYDLSGAVEGGTIIGTYMSTYANEVYRTTFVGTLEGRTMTLTPIRVTQDGQDGTCRLSGSYHGERTISG